MSRAPFIRFPDEVKSMGNVALRAQFATRYGVGHESLLEARNIAQANHERLTAPAKESLLTSLLAMWPIWSTVFVFVSLTELVPWDRLGVRSWVAMVCSFSLPLLYVVVALRFHGGMVARRRKKAGQEVDRAFEELCEARERASKADQFAKDLATLGTALGPRSDSMSLEELAVECQKKLDNQMNGLRQLLRTDPRCFLGQGDGQKHLSEFFQNLDAFKRLGIEVTEPRWSMSGSGIVKK